ncbi:peptidoglycan recognition protein [Streptomyces sp. AK02-01A]|uniref:peptidoglycan recognition protein family protein n=1 Tax=Streptomyces sp. AK02-01A TaxID=3028648 RepID=UPI0029BABCDF|nr:peptidoglycan recognition protein [Streptomyces sp. AK02-01A]MDX3854791.1 peptidoglycan recognition protein [Streptomyces sp. AK02-01A]
MRAYLATSIGVACTAALILPLSLPSGAVAAPGAAVPRAVHQRAASQPTVPPDTAEPPGSTQSLPLASLGMDRALGSAARQGLNRRDVRSFSLLGLVWENADEELNGRVQVRTRASGTRRWSHWQELETHNQEHGADRGTEERDSGTVRGSTAPLWVGGSDGVEVRVRAAGRPGAAGPPRTRLPEGLRLELVDPGNGSSSSGGTVAEIGVTPDDIVGDAGRPPRRQHRSLGASVPNDARSANAGLTIRGGTEIPALSRKQTMAALRYSRPHVGPRPRIITRRGWGANERLRERELGYTGSVVKAAFVHHTGTGNNYHCAQSPSVLRSIYRYHVKSSGWRDIGYNFAIDRCGNIYEGRAGGVARSVVGAHTLGFNTNSMGIAVLGTYNRMKPPAATTTAIARLTAWKLGMYGVNPRGKVTLTSAGSDKYRRGMRVRLNTISGHRDGFATECPGTRLYEKLGKARSSSAWYQGR